MLFSYYKKGGALLYKKHFFFFFIIFLNYIRDIGKTFQSGRNIFL